MAAHLIAGRYQMLEQVASTARAKSYRAIDTLTGTPRLIHIVSGSLAVDTRFVANFHRQAHLAADLVQPNVCRLLDYGRTGEGYFLAEEWVDGANLRDYLDARGPLPVSDALAIASDIAAALAAAHRAGLVHGGLSPDNMFVRADGVVKVGDFGLAKPPGMPVWTEGSGTRAVAYYMSPEQSQGETAGPASDVYALGALLYAILTGQPPFQAATPLAVALKHVNEDAEPIRHLRPSVPSDVAALVTQSLAKQPAQRYRDGAELAAAIHGLAAYQPGLLPPPMSALRPPSLFERLTTAPVTCLVGVFVFLLVLAIGGVLFLMAGQEARQPPIATPLPASVAMPNFVGGQVADAQSIARDNGLQLSVTQRPDPKIDHGIVLEQSPVSGVRVAKGASVQIVVSQGPRRIVVPNLVGLGQPEAQAMIRREGLQTGQITQRASAPENQGMVLGQSPPPGTTVGEGRPVDLVIGAGVIATATSPAGTATSPAVLPPEAPSPSPSPYPSATASPSATALSTLTPTIVATTATATATATATPIPSRTPTPTPTPIPTPTSTSTSIPTPTLLPTLTPTTAPNTPTPTPIGLSPTATASPTPAGSPSASPTVSGSASERLAMKA